ncbi:LysR family transcriptional regulator [Janibacter terrae]|uniref:LysR family transcriptional regulator n=1 Tax=Janibacter terrae TaxID=103817 RepID=UPI00083993F2|nr:LysR family transcriptional regulator [Janibacter terrae]
MQFTLRRLTVFATLARTGHFGRAADALGLAQPTVSGEIRGLERTLGVRLFERSRAGTTLTPAGRELLPAAQEVLDAAHRFESAVDRVSATREVVRLAASPSLVNRVVPQALRAVGALDDGPLVEVVEVLTGGVSAALTAGEAEVGIGHLVDRVAGTKRATLGADELCVLAARGRLPAGEPADLGALEDLRLLIWPREQNPAYYDLVLRACDANGAHPRVVESTTRFSGSYSYLLTDGQAFALVPIDYAREAPASLAWAPLRRPARLPLHVTWRNDPTRGAQVLLEALSRTSREGA